MPIKIVPLDSLKEPIFWNYVMRNVPEHYFFILDWKLNKDKTQIFLALEDSEITGLMLIYDQHVIQIRGSSISAELLITKANLENADINAPKEHEAIILKKYEPVTKHDMILMTLRKGAEKPRIKHRIEKLKTTDAQQIARLVNESFPELIRLRSITPEEIIERIRTDVLFLGIKEQGRLISLGNARVLDFGTNIGMIATREEYRNQGCATSIVSALLKEIFQESQLALIHVLSDNYPAVWVYTNVGFKPYKSYSFIQGKKIT